MAYTTIDDPSAHFQVLTYRGNSSSTTSADRTLTNEGNSNLQPDLLGLWNRDTGTNSGARWYDSSRGVGQNKGIQSSSNGLPGGGNDPEFGYVNTFHSDGFGVRAGANDANGRWTTDRGEGGGDKYVAYQWKANGGSTTSVSESGSGNGGINACTYQANTTAGFSIIKYTGHRGSGIGDNNHTNVTHGLSSAPNFIIIKNLSINSNWLVGGHHIGEYSGPFANRHMKLNSTEARDGGDYVFNVAADSTYVYVGNNNEANGDGNSIIMYAFHDVQGYSKFGSYTGNAVNSNGPFVYTGFKPAFVLLKNMDATEPWIMIDTKRNPGNPADKKLGVHSYSAENGVSGQGDANYNKIDILSNGFNMRQNNGASNGSGNTFMYMTFAEEPLVSSGGVPATAR